MLEPLEGHWNGLMWLCRLLSPESKEDGGQLGEQLQDGHGAEPVAGGKGG